MSRMIRFFSAALPICISLTIFVNAQNLEPVDISNLYPASNNKERLIFHAPKGTSIGTVYSYQIKDYVGNVVAEGKSTVDMREVLPVELTLPEGYHEILFNIPNTQPIGFWNQTEKVPSDSFFSIDAALSWLSKKKDIPYLIKSLKQVVGNEGLVRERFSWGETNPENEKWDWGANRKSGPYEVTLQNYSQEGVKVLEVFHDPPGWVGKAQNGRFPDDLIGVEKSWENIAKRLSPFWTALEVWNEPDIGPGAYQPADQYLPIVKTTRYAMRSSGIKTPIGGGVFATMNPMYLDLSARNGLLDESDFISFHYYGDPLGLEKLIAQYRTWLKRYNYETKPLWLTEVGQWRGGQTGIRPNTDIQANIALTQAMQAVESKACGVERCFPFVYVDYSEKGGERHFGMLDQAGTPLRQLAAYAFVARELAWTNYLGDIPTQSVPGSKKIRVFEINQKNKISPELLVVIYTGIFSPTAKLKIPFAIQSIRGIDGRLLQIDSSGAVPVPDGIAYLRVKNTAIDMHLKKDTEAMRLYRLGKETSAPKLPAISSIILQPQLDPESVQSMSSRGYFLNPDSKHLSVKVWVNNFANEQRNVELQAADSSKVFVTIPPHSRKQGILKVDISTLPRDNIADAIRLAITAKSSDGERIAPIELALFSSDGDRGLAEHLKESKYQFALSLGEEYRWDKNSSGTLSFTNKPQAAFGFLVTFPAENGWAYPRFTLPQEVDQNRITGVLVRAKCPQQQSKVCLMSWNEEGATHVTSFPIIPSDGEWHVAYIPFSSYMAEGKLSKVSVGLNSKTKSSELYISDIYLIGK